MAKNKLTKFAEMAKYENVFQTPFEKLRDEGFPLKGKWNTFFKNDNPIILELGCGKGEYTIGLAREHNNKNCIGIYIKGARIWSGATQAINEKLNNVAFIRTHVELINSFFSDNEISEIWITFPDPQMKKTNKRLTSTRFMKEYSQILKKDGLIHLKTDSNFLYSYTKEMIKENKLQVLIDTQNLYNSSIKREIPNIQTYYEQQWLDRGLNIKYIQFLCPKDKEWIEPEVEIEKDAYRSFGRSRRIQSSKDSEHLSLE